MYKVKILCWISITLAEFLETKTSVSQDLSGNVSSGSDFNTGADHFERAPVLVFDQVLDEFVRCFCVELVGGIADTGAIRNEFLRICDAHICKSLSWL
jgi:hypothetical protein